MLDLAALIAAVLFGTAACAFAQAALRRVALGAAELAAGFEGSRRDQELRARELAIEERRLTIDERDQERDHADAEDDDEEF